MKSKSQFDFVPRDTEESELMDLVDFGGVAISVGKYDSFLNATWHFGIWGGGFWSVGSMKV